MAGGGGGEGKVACAAWIRRREEKEKATRVFAAYGRAGSPPAVEVLGFDSKECSLSEPLARAELGEEPGDAPRGITVHPSGDELVCATAKGCRCVPPLLLFSLTVLSFAGISQAGRGGVI
jgi:prolactin regulatory element-binding protein